MGVAVLLELRVRVLGREIDHVLRHVDHTGGAEFACSGMAWKKMYVTHKKKNQHLSHKTKARKKIARQSKETTFVLMPF